MNTYLIQHKNPKTFYNAPMFLKVSTKCSKLMNSEYQQTNKISNYFKNKYDHVKIKSKSINQT